LKTKILVIDLDLENETEKSDQLLVIVLLLTYWLITTKWRQQEQFLSIHL